MVAKLLKIGLSSHHGTRTHRANEVAHPIASLARLSESIEGAGEIEKGEGRVPQPTGIIRLVYAGVGNISSSGAPAERSLLDSTRAIFKEAVRGSSWRGGSMYLG